MNDIDEYGMIPKGHIMLWPGPRWCPKCTKVTHFPFDSTYAGCSEKPVYLVKRVNKSTGDWFYGCPNFPSCRHSENRPDTKRERDIKTRAWANALGRPHF